MYQLQEIASQEGLRGHGSSGYFQPEVRDNQTENLICASQGQVF